MTEHVAILTSKESWYFEYAAGLLSTLEKNGYKSEIFSSYENIPDTYDTVFILSYFKIIKPDLLKKHSYNMVVHESALPEGKGWAPYFWQIIKGYNRIQVVLFEAVEEVDAGPIYLKDFINLDGTELNHELRKKQAEVTEKLCLNFLENRKTIVPVEQEGDSTFFDRRTPESSELDIDKTIREQFNLLRTVENEEYPAFFKLNGKKYILKVYKDE